MSERTISEAGWRLTRGHGSAAVFHARPLKGELVRAVHVWEVDRPAVVLGSAQHDVVVDRAACAAAGVEVVRRPSGGGAVLLDPGLAVWIDVELPRGDPCWDDDVGRAAWWLGDRWRSALEALGVAQPTVHRGALLSTEWSSLVCFAGLGPGEVTAGPGGPKVLGIAQRRTRAGARFQCAVPLAWDPGRLASCLFLSERESGRLVADLAHAVDPVAAPPQSVVEAFLNSLG